MYVRAWFRLVDGSGASFSNWSTAVAGSLTLALLGRDPQGHHWAGSLVPNGRGTRTEIRRHAGVVKLPWIEHALLQERGISIAHDGTRWH
jgi:hypothetical protein